MGVFALSTRPHGAALWPAIKISHPKITSRAGPLARLSRVSRTPAGLNAGTAAITPALAAEAAPRLVRRPARSLAASAMAWSFFKKLGFKKPAFLPDFGLKKRRALLQRFFSRIDRRVYEKLLAPDFLMVEEGTADNPTRTFTREDFIDLMCNRVSPAIPDFTWTAATDGVVDDEGYAIVEVEPSGHHTGAPLDLGPGLPSVPPTGSRFKLPVAVKRVRVEDGAIREIRTVGGEDAGPLVLYRAVGGGRQGQAVGRS